MHINIQQIPFRLSSAHLESEKYKVGGVEGEVEKEESNVHIEINMYSLSAMAEFKLEFATHPTCVLTGIIRPVTLSWCLEFFDVSLLCR